MSKDRPQAGQIVRKLIILAVLAVVSAGVIFLLDAGRVLRPLQHMAYDGLVYLRAKTGLEPDRPASPVVIVKIDDRTFADKDFRLPQALWHNYFSMVIQGLAMGGAKTIGLDFLLPQALFDDLVPEYSRTWLKSFVFAKSQGAPVVSGLVETAARQVRPEARYLQIIGPDHIGFFNLTTDSDDFIRRQRLFIPSKNNTEKGLYSVTFLLAKAYKPGLTLPAETIYIDYNPAGQAFAGFSFAEVRQRALDRDMEFLRKNFQGKIVLIGETDSLSQDRHPTPLYYLTRAGQKRTPGVEILGHTISTILGQRFYAGTKARARFFIYLGLALIVCAYTIYGRQRYLLVLSPGLILGYGGASLAAFTRYTIPPLVGGALVILLSQAASSAYRYWVIDREKRKIRSIFQRYLPGKVVRRLLATRDEDFFLGESKRLCLMFTDIRSFTTYSEKKEPAEVVGRLNEYFEAMSAVIVSEGGVVDKFLGDGIMAFFGAFDEKTPPSLAGARAALKMLAGLERLNAGWEARGEETFRIGVGMHTGIVKIGNIGSHNKMEYTVIGDAVNLASRLQDKTKVLGEPIVMSEETYHDLAGAAMAGDKGFSDIKGRAQSRVYALKGLKGEL